MPRGSVCGAKRKVPDRNARTAGNLGSEWEQYYTNKASAQARQHHRTKGAQSNSKCSSMLGLAMGRLIINNACSQGCRSIDTHIACKQVPANTIGHAHLGSEWEQCSFRPRQRLCASVSLVLPEIH